MVQRNNLFCALCRRGRPCGFARLPQQVLHAKPFGPGVRQRTGSVGVQRAAQKPSLLRLSLERRGRVSGAHGQRGDWLGSGKNVGSHRHRSPADPHRLPSGPGCFLHYAH